MRGRRSANDDGKETSVSTAAPFLQLPGLVGAVGAAAAANANVPLPLSPGEHQRLATTWVTGVTAVTSAPHLAWLLWICCELGGREDRDGGEPRPGFSQGLLPFGPGLVSKKFYKIFQIS